MSPVIVLLLAALAIFFVGRKSTSCGVSLGLVIVIIFIIWAVFNTTVELG